MTMNPCLYTCIDQDSKAEAIQYFIEENKGYEAFHYMYWI